VTADDDDPPIGQADVEQLRERVHDAGDLGRLRSAMRAFLLDRQVPDDVVADVMIAVSELTTNAIQAASGDWPTGVCVELRAEQDGARSIVATVDNTGDPFPGTMEVSPHLIARPEQTGGRGLGLAARLGSVRIEGRIGGTRAVFERLL
jgi:anti-sigma regulatory factor (Ser/Thr protein kinase)